MTEKKDPNHGPAVADEDPDHSPMDKGKDRKDEKKREADQPGAAGFRTARADEDTYD